LPMILLILLLTAMRATQLNSCYVFNSY
jgi:hypothetical protein